MISTRYMASKNSATVAIAKYGAPIKVYRPVAVDPIEGGAGEPTLVGNAHALMTNYSIGVTDGERIKPGDKQFLVAADFEIKDADRIVAESEPWSAVLVREVNPDGSGAIVSKVQCRR